MDKKRSDGSLIHGAIDARIPFPHPPGEGHGPFPYELSHRSITLESKPLMAHFPAHRHGLKSVSLRFNIHPYEPVSTGLNPSSLWFEPQVAWCRHTHPHSTTRVRSRTLPLRAFRPFIQPRVQAINGMFPRTSPRIKIRVSQIQTD